MDSQYDSSYGSQGQQQRHSNSELFSSAKVVADAAQSAFRHDTSNLDRSKVADATGDLLDAAGQYGKVDEKSGFGKCLDKAADYLHDYSSSGTNSGRSGSGYGVNNDRSSGGDGDNNRSGGGYGDSNRSSGSYGDSDLSGGSYMSSDRSEGGYRDSDRYGSNDRSDSGYGGGRSGGGYGDERSGGGYGNERSGSGYGNDRDGRDGRDGRSGGGYGYGD